jgi:hypothetical protein
MGFKIVVVFLSSISFVEAVTLTTAQMVFLAAISRRHAKGLVLCRLPLLYHHEVCKVSVPFTSGAVYTLHPATCCSIIYSNV